MDLNVAHHDDVTRVQLPTRLVMSNADETREALKRLIDAGSHHLVVDMEAMTFIDSSGLAVLIAVYKYLGALNGQLVLLSPSSNVRALIELTRLHQLFTIYEDADAAIQDLRAA